MTATLTAGDEMLREIIAHPDKCDDVRLIYADWLEEVKGEGERAEFIRDQVQWRAGCRDFDLLDAHLEAWCPWFERHDEDGFHRQRAGPSGLRCGGLMVPHFGGERTYWLNGFIAYVRLPLAAWQQHGPALVRSHPITRVELSDAKIVNSISTNGFILWAVRLPPVDGVHGGIRLNRVTGLWYAEQRALLNSLSAALLDDAKAMPPATPK